MSSQQTPVPAVVFGKIVEGHMELPRQIMRRFKSVPEEQSVSAFLEDLCSSLRQGSLQRTNLVREHRQELRDAANIAASDSAKRMMSRSKDLLDLAHAEATSMVRMAKKLRRLQVSVAPLERAYCEIRSAGDGGQLGTGRDRAAALHLGLSALAAKIMHDTNAGLIEDTADPYRGTPRLMDYLDLSDAAIDPVLENMRRGSKAAELEQLDRFVRGVILPRIEELIESVAEFQEP